MPPLLHVENDQARCGPSQGHHAKTSRRQGALILCLLPYTPHPSRHHPASPRFGNARWSGQSGIGTPSLAGNIRLCYRPSQINAQFHATSQGSRLGTVSNRSWHFTPPLTSFALRLAYRSVLSFDHPSLGGSSNSKIRLDQL